MPDDQPTGDDRQQRMRELQKQLQTVGAAAMAAAPVGMSADAPATDFSSPHPAEIFSTGCAAFDEWFPQGGMVRGQTVELIANGRGSGATVLAMILARAICGEDGLLVLIDRQQTFYPALLLSLGFDLENVLFVYPQSEEDHLWALEQALADRAVAAVWTDIDKLDKRYQRRWQLAAERGQTVGLLQRPSKVLGHPTWAKLQVEVRPNPHSHWLVTHPRVADAAPGSAENWIVQLVVQRGVARFERLPLQLELCNHHDPLQPDVPSVFLQQRLTRPGDPWFTKPGVTDVDAAAPAAPATIVTDANSAERLLQRRRS
jgi:hypothetical protein